MTYQHEQFWVSIDCLVFGYDTSEERIKLLAFQRRIPPFEGQWSLIGGFVNQNEDLDAAAKRVLKKFTGLEDVFLEQLGTYGKYDRDPGGRVFSVLYWSLIKLDHIHHEIVENHGAAWYNLDEIPPLIMDHHAMVNHGFQQLQNNIKTSPVGFELLPEEFTIPQLKQLYDSIHGLPIDDRNFRKKMLKSDLLVKLDKKDKSTSKKGAFLYSFDAEKYSQLKREGYFFDFLNPMG